jgi:hypothetical protein
MNSKEYAAKMQNIAGAITALCNTNMPCATNCAAHPVQVQTTALQAQADAAHAEFWGNGAINEIADAVVAKLDGKRTPSVSDGATPWAWFVAAYKTNPVMRNAVTLAAIALLSAVPTCSSRGVKELAITALQRSIEAKATAQTAAAKAAVTSSNVTEIVSLLEWAQ